MSENASQLIKLAESLPLEEKILLIEKVFSSIKQEVSNPQRKTNETSLGNPSIRTLLEIASEFNVGTETIKSFLKSIGVEGSFKPGSIINTEVYSLISIEFEKDKLTKEKSLEIKLSESPSLMDNTSKNDQTDENNTSRKRRLYDPESATMNALKRGDADIFGF